MANEQNLRPSEYKLSQEEAKKGGIASGEARRKKRDLRNALEMLLESQVNVVDKQSGEVIQMTGTQAVTRKLFEQAMKGNIKAFIAIRETTGQDPVQKIAVSEVSSDVIDEIENAVLEDE